MQTKTNIPDVTIEKIERRNGQSSLWIIRRNGVQLGLIERYPAQVGEEHPYKAFAGKGERMLGVHYVSDMPSKRGVEAKSRALRMIVDNADAIQYATICL